MKKIVLLLGALAFAAGCSGNNNNSSSSGSTGSTTSTGTTGTTSATTTGTTTTGGGSTGQTGSTTTTTGGSGSTGGTTTGGSSGSSGSSGTSATCDGTGVANDACGGAIALTAGTPVTGDTTNAKTDLGYDQNGSCSIYGMTNDLVYSFTAPADGKYRFDVTANDTTFDAELAVLDSCTAAPISTCLGGADNGIGGEPETVTVSLSANTTYYVVVGAYDCTSLGTFTLTATQLPPPTANDVCSGATAITLTNGEATVTGDNSGDNADYASPTCGGLSNDLFYTLDVAQTSRVTLTLSPTSSNGIQPVVDLLSSCLADGGADEVNCGATVDGTSPAILDLNNVAAGTYTVVVDGFNSSAGPFSLDVKVGAPATAPANDACTGAAAITLSDLGDGGLSGSAAFDVFASADDIQPSASDQNSSCIDPNSGSPYPSAGDVAFAVTTPDGGVPSLTATWIQPDGGTDQLGVAGIIVTDSPCGTGAELTCGPASVSVTSGDGGALPGNSTYYIWVDQVQGTQAPSGSLQVTVP